VSLNNFAALTVWNDAYRVWFDLPDTRVHFAMVPDWLHLLSIAYLSLGGLCAAIIAVDLIGHPQHMWIMNVVWPVTALFGTVWILWQYLWALSNQGESPRGHGAEKGTAQ
jgi:hypothetical protein